MGYTIVTNNVQCKDRYQGEYEVRYNGDWSYLDVLFEVRNLVHLGKLLITHPMAGSLKPNQTPYRTVVLGDKTMEDKKAYEDIELIENSIESCQKFCAAVFYLTGQKVFEKIFGHWISRLLKARCQGHQDVNNGVHIVVR